jgi:hypothetical protein
MWVPVIAKCAEPLWCFGIRCGTNPVLPDSQAMTYTINTHDSWGIVKVGNFHSLEEARKVFSSLCEDPWYKSDGMVKGVELIQDSDQGQGIRMDWFAFR